MKVFVCSISLFSSLCLPSYAQIFPDRYLGIESTQIVNNGETIFIEGGAFRGNTLFHSFEEFNIRTGEQVYFNSDNVEQIFSRITGNNTSLIDGVLGSVGNADVYIINPNGIVFGANASLDVNGSFFATTATTAFFESGIEYSTEMPKSVPPLLRVRGDIGFRYQRPTSTIELFGRGHRLQLVDDVSYNPFVNAGEMTDGLNVPVGESITLIGGSVIFEGGILAAPSGDIVIGALGLGEILVNTDQAYRSDVIKGGIVSLSDLSLIDVSGVGRGSIHVFGEQLDVRSGSYLVNQNSGIISSRDISLQVDTLFISGMTQQEELGLVASGSGIRSFTVLGDGSSIDIDAKQIHLLDGGGIAAATYGTGIGGDINISAEQFTLEGSSSQVGEPSYIQSLSLGNGDGGDITIAAETLTVKNGGFLSTNAATVLGQSLSGNIHIDANYLQVLGRNPDIRRRSILFTGSRLNSSSGNLSIASDTIAVSDGAFLGSYSFGVGQPGNVDIKASQVNLSGFSNVPSRTFASERSGEVDKSSDIIRSPSEIDFSNFTSTSHLDRTIIASLFIPEIQEINDSGIPLFPNISGNFSIKSDVLNISDNAFITVVNGASGQAGDVNIDVEILSLDEGGISADIIQSVNPSDFNVGGSIDIKSDVIYLSNSSLISSSASGFSNGGNLNIGTRNIILVDSLVRANGQIGLGGSVSIDSDSLYSSNSSILATSEISSRFDGNVEFEVGKVFTEPRTLDYNDEFINAPIHYRGCYGNLDVLILSLANFDESNVLGTSQAWLPASITSAYVDNQIHDSSDTMDYLEASSWIVNRAGEVELISLSNNSQRESGCVS
ncbi:MAG: filamentous hemagglutinin N-terminal domain-containing protein [Cyanobacteria bacterium P01_F01_bin.150]